MCYPPLLANMLFIILNCHSYEKYIWSVRYDLFFIFLSSFIVSPQIILFIYLFGSMESRWQPNNPIYIIAWLFFYDVCIIEYCMQKVNKLPHYFKLLSDMLRTHHLVGKWLASIHTDTHKTRYLLWKTFLYNTGMVLCLNHWSNNILTNSFL